jgi:hypothetical protein
MGKPQLVTGSAQCPTCKGTTYTYQPPNFRCTSCGLLVDSVGKPVPKPLSCSKPHSSSQAEAGADRVEQTGVAIHDS